MIYEGDPEKMPDFFGNEEVREDQFYKGKDLDVASEWLDIQDPIRTHPMWITTDRPYAEGLDNMSSQEEFAGAGPGGDYYTAIGTGSAVDFNFNPEYDHSLPNTQANFGSWRLPEVYPHCDYHSYIKARRTWDSPGGGGSSGNEFERTDCRCALNTDNPADVCEKDQNQYQADVHPLGGQNIPLGPMLVGWACGFDSPAYNKSLDIYDSANQKWTHNIRYCLDRETCPALLDTNNYDGWFGTNARDLGCLEPVMGGGSLHAGKGFVDLSMPEVPFGAGFGPDTAIMGNDGERASPKP